MPLLAINALDKAAKKHKSEPDELGQLETDVDFLIKTNPPAGMGWEAYLKRMYSEALMNSLFHPGVIPKITRFDPAPPMISPMEEKIREKILKRRSPNSLQEIEEMFGLHKIWL